MLQDNDMTAPTRFGSRLLDNRQEVYICNRVDLKESWKRYVRDGFFRFRNDTTKMEEYFISTQRYIFLLEEGFLYINLKQTKV